MFDSLSNVIATDTFWVALGAIGAVIALFMTFLQLRASRIIAATDFVLRLESSFCSKDMISKRKKMMSTIKKSPNDFAKMDALRDVFDFFEDLGLMFRKGVIPKDIVWSNYCYWILNYWTALHGYVDWARNKENDPTLYCEFEYLYKKIQGYEVHRRKKKVVITPEMTVNFIEDELNLLSC
jgi:hypothetical protein